MRPKPHKILLLSKVKSFGNVNGPVEIYLIFRLLKFLQDELSPDTDKNSYVSQPCRGGERNMNWGGGGGGL